MMFRDGYRDDRLIESLQSALEVLGESSKQAIMYYMAKQYGISFDSSNPSSLEEIEAALIDILGPGSDIITKKLYSELQRIP